MTRPQAADAGVNIDLVYPATNTRVAPGVSDLEKARVGACCNMPLRSGEWMDQAPDVPGYSGPGRFCVPGQRLEQLVAYGSWRLGPLKGSYVYAQP